MTSAPRSERIMPPRGPAWYRANSSTLIPSRAPPMTNPPKTCVPVELTPAPASCQTIEERRRRASMAYEYIVTEHFDGVAVITLNRPDKLNALSFPLVRELDEALTAYEADGGIIGVV